MMKEKNRISSFVKAHTNNVMLSAVLLIVFVGMTMVVPNFLSAINISNLLFQYPEYLLLTMGMMVVIMSGGINLAITVSGMLGAVFGLAIMNRLIEAGMAEPIAIFAALVISIVICLAIGLVEGYLVGYLNVPPILATLGMQQFVIGAGTVGAAALTAKSATSLVAISGFPVNFQMLGAGAVFGIPLSFIICAVLTVMMYYMLHKTSFGFKIQMIGSNTKVSEYSGIDTKKELMKAYVLSAMMSCVAALIMSSRYNQAKVDTGSSYLMLTIVASVIGGTHIDGGSGNLIGTVLAVTILHILTNGLMVLGLPQSVILVISALVLIAVILLREYVNRDGKKKTAKNKK